VSFVLYGSRSPSSHHPFPTRRSSDLIMLEDDATVQLLSESQTRFVISAKPENMEAVETLFSEIHCLGEVTDDQQFRINHNGQAMIQEKVSDIRNWWNNAIQNHLKSDM